MSKASASSTQASEKSEVKSAPQTTTTAAPTAVASKGRNGEEECMVCVGQKVRARPSAQRDGYRGIDVTSGSLNKLGDHPGTQLSPLYLDVEVIEMNGMFLLEEEVAPDIWAKSVKIKVKYEHVWQLRKIYKELGHLDEEKKCPTAKFWSDFQKQMHARDCKNANKGVRRPNHVRRGWKPIGHWFQARLLNYVEARLYLYAGIYGDRIRTVPFFLELQKLVVKSKARVMIKDVDGPPMAVKDGNGKWVPKYPNGRLLTLALLSDVLHDTAYPMGHGYVVAAAILGLVWPKLA